MHGRATYDMVVYCCWVVYGYFWRPTLPPIHQDSVRPTLVCSPVLPQG